MSEPLAKMTHGTFVGKVHSNAKFSVHGDHVHGSSVHASDQVRIPSHGVQWPLFSVLDVVDAVY